MHYIPNGLDNEPVEFTEKLGFLGAPFTFPRGQLPLFLRTVYTNMGEALADGDDSDDNSVELVG